MNIKELAEQAGMQTIEYTITIQHSMDGEVNIKLHDVGDSESDRKAIAYALEQAINLVLSGDTAIFH